MVKLRWFGFRWFGLVLVLTMASTAAGDAPSVGPNSLDRYKSIVERPPFKKVGVPAAPPAQTSIQGLLLTGLFVDGSTRKAWIRDTRTQQSYGVREGETVLDFRVEKIDPDNQTVTLTRGVETQALTFPRAPAAAPPTAVAGFQPRPMAVVPGQWPQRTTAAGGAAVSTVPAGGIVPVVSGQGTTTTVSRASLRRRILQQQFNPAGATTAAPVPTPPAQPAGHQPEGETTEGETTGEEAPAAAGQ